MHLDSTFLAGYMWAAMAYRPAAETELCAVAQYSLCSGYIAAELV